MDNHTKEIIGGFLIMEKFNEVVKKFNVKSLANGNYIIECEYNTEPIEEGATPIGLFSRLAIAEEVQRFLVNQKAK